MTPPRTSASEPAPATQAEAERDGFAVVEALNAENAALKDRVLRTLAEMENLRRRTEREAADARTYAVTAFARDMLNVVDNLSRALESLPENARAGGRRRAQEPHRRRGIDGARSQRRARRAMA